MKMWLPGLTNRCIILAQILLIVDTATPDVDEFFIAAGYDIRAWTDVPIWDMIRDAIGDTGNTYTVDRSYIPVDQGDTLI